MTGATPTRISTWGAAALPVSVPMRLRLAANSVMCVSGQVAILATVHSSNTVDSISPHRKCVVAGVLIGR